MATITERSRRVASNFIKAFTLLVVSVTILAFAVPVGFLLVRLSRSVGCEYCSLYQRIRDFRLVIGQATIERRVKPSIELVRIDSDGYALWSTPIGRIWLPDREPQVPFQLASEQERDAYPSCRSGDVVIDCGAHVGVTVRRALHNGAALVIAVEPAPRNLECLRRNLADEIGRGRVILYPKGVWHKDGVLQLAGAGNSLQQNVTNVGIVSTVTVPLTTIDKLVSELGLEKVDFIKIDIEGAERHALAGAVRTLARHRPRLAIAGYHLPDDPEVLPKVVLDANRTYLVSGRYCRNWYGRGRFIPEVLLFQ